jgi:ribosomal protein S20
MDKDISYVCLASGPIRNESAKPRGSNGQRNSLNNEKVLSRVRNDVTANVQTVLEQSAQSPVVEEARKNVAARLQEGIVDLHNARREESVVVHAVAYGSGGEDAGR